ncbi:hemolysin-III channel protein Izh2 [Xylariomycetidae sp. FL0641]|nr:hemolysin-III channel protein Izh2 [Xylariomycetidae sp. FL0641]
MASATAPGPSSVRHRGRRRSSAASSALSSAVHAAESKVSSALLVAWEELPGWRRDNGYLRTGYRRDSHSYLASLRSVFRVHNESVNIWTHLLGAVGFPALGAYLHARGGLAAAPPRYPPTADRGDVVAFAAFFAGAAACLGLSAAYHALCNHSPRVAAVGNKLDYAGIVCLIVGSYVPALHYGLFCMPEWRRWYLYGIFTLGLGCGVVSWVEVFRTPMWRPYRAAVFVGLGASGVVPVCHALTIYGYRSLDERMGLSWVLLQGFFYIFGAFLYAVRWPERSFPKTFDIWGSSHQLFHILILLAAASHLKGMAKAFDYHHSVMGAQC